MQKRNRLNKILSWYIFPCLVVLAGAGSTGCSDKLTEATALGTSFASTDVTIRDTTITASGSSSFREFTAMNGRTNLLGHSGGYDARMLLQFYPAYFGNNDTAAVLSAKLKLRAVMWFGDSSATFAFTVHKVLSEWNQSTVRWDSLMPSYEPAVRGQFSGTIVSDTQLVVVDLDTALVREWIRPNTITQYGIMLIPTAAANVVRGFHAFDYDSTKFYPTLDVITRSYGSGILDTTTYNLGADTFVGNNDNPVPNPSLIFSQSGVVYRSTIRFDVSFIPPGAAIVSSLMTLTQDPPTSRLNKFKGDSLAVAHLALSETNNRLFEAQGALASNIGANRYSFDLRHITQSWTIGPNYGLVLRNSNFSEFSTFDLFTFYGHLATDPAARPKLRIRYAVEKGRDG